MYDKIDTESRDTMNKKGFTLIELLAVIIILGVLATLIAPKVVTMLKEAEKNTQMSSAEGLLKAAIYKGTNNQITGDSTTTVVNYSTKENVSYIEYNGSKPTAGQVKINSYGNVQMAVKFGDSCYKKTSNIDDITVIPYDENTCKVSTGIEVLEQQDQSKPSVGDRIKIGTEEFIVIESNNEKTTMIGKYNLYVGSIYSHSGTKVRDIASSEEGYNLQSSIAKGYTNTEEDKVGVVPFANTPYWYENVEYSPLKEKYYAPDSFFNNIYDEDYSSATGDNYSVAYYIKEYVNKLIALGAPSNTKGSILTLKQFGSLSSEIKTSGATYWLATCYQNNNIDSISWDGNSGTSPYDSNSVGLRPVITINTYDL